MGMKKLMDVLGFVLGWEEGKKNCRVGMKGWIIGVLIMGAFIFLFTLIWADCLPHFIWPASSSTTAITPIQLEPIPQPPLSIPGSHNKSIIDVCNNKTKSCKGIYELMVRGGVSKCLKENQMLKEAARQGSKTSNLNPKRIAFLFLVRGKIPHEPLWKRFFNNTNTSSYFSIYVHARPSFKFPSNSFFWHKEITPSHSVARFSITMVDAMRRLFAHALLDKDSNNAWFVFVCESTIPIRSFPYVYNYLMSSRKSHVQAFHPGRAYIGWKTLPTFRKDQLMKGELWMALNRKHAITVVSDSKFYQSFKKKCKNSVDGKSKCTPDEQYIQTLLSTKDQLGITRNTIMYVDWSNHHQKTQYYSLISGSPFCYTRSEISPRLIHNIQRHGKLSKFGRSHPCDKIETIMPHNTNQHHNKSNIVNINLPHCFLFARKFSKDATLRLQKLPQGVLGY